VIRALASAHRRSGKTLIANLVTEVVLVRYPSVQLPLVRLSPWQRERIEVRGWSFAGEAHRSTLTLPLSLGKGEATLATLVKPTTEKLGNSLVAGGLEINSRQGSRLLEIREFQSASFNQHSNRIH
jgi:hypothetical protein